VSLTINTRAIARFLPDNVRYLAGLAEPPAVLPAEEAETGFSEQFGYSLDFWWLYLFYMGKLSAPAAVTAGGSLLAVAAFEFWRVKRLADETAMP
jgi:hypothetical protein